MLQGSRCGCRGLWFKVQGLRFRVEGFGVQGSVGFIGGHVKSSLSDSEPKVCRHGLWGTTYKGLNNQNRVLGVAIYYEYDKEPQGTALQILHASL